MPTETAIRALPVAASAFPDFPIETTPLPAGTAPHAFASWKREGTHAFSSWSCDEVVPHTLTGGGGLGRAIGDYYHHILPARRRPYALLWRDVRGVLLPAAGGHLNRGDAFTGAARDTLDRIVARQGFRDALFMAEARALLAGGDHERLRLLLPRSRPVLTTVAYQLVHGPHGTYWEGYLPTELATTG